MLEVDITDLFHAVLNNDNNAMTQWLCRVRDADCEGSRAKTRALSKAFEAVVQSLIRLFCAKYLSRSLAMVETFRQLLVACIDSSVDLHLRWQRAANICSLMASSSAKPKTIHVYPGLQSPVMELDEHDENQRQPKITAALSKQLVSYSERLKQYFKSIPDQRAPATDEWLESDTLNDGTHRDTFATLEFLLRARRIKEAHRMVSYLVMHAKNVKSTFHTDIVDCVWHLVQCIAASMRGEAAISEDALDYVHAAHCLYRTMLPAKRNARICRLGLLHYAMIVMTEGRSHGRFIAPVTAAINLPATVPKSLAYLTIFPKS